MSYLTLWDMDTSGGGFECGPGPVHAVGGLVAWGGSS